MTGFWSMLRPPDRVTAWVVLVSVLVPVAYVQFGHPRFYLEVLAPIFGVAGHPLADMHARLYQFATAFALFFVCPALVWRLALGFGIAQAGVRAGDLRFGWRSLFAATVLAVPLAYLSAGQADFQAEYPLSRVAAQEVGRFAAYEAALLLYYVGWEFLFRGFMLFGLRGRFGDFGAVAMQTFPSVLLHIGKPAGELWASVAGGFLLGAWALRTQSILYVLAFHYFLGVLNDVFCAWRGGLIG